MTFNQNSSLGCDSLGMPGLITAPDAKTTSQDEAEHLANTKSIDKTRGHHPLPAAASPNSCRDGNDVPFPIPLRLGSPQTQDDVLELQKLSVPIEEWTTEPTEPTNMYAAWALIISRMTKSKFVEFVLMDSQTEKRKPEAGTPANVSTMSICIDSDGQQSVQSYLDHVQNQQNKFWSSGAKGVCKPSKDTESRLFRKTLLSIHSVPNTTNPGHPLQGAEEEQPRWRAGAALILAIDFGTDRTDITASFNSGAISEWTMAHLYRQLKFVLRQMKASALSQSVSTIVVATPDEIQSIWQWNPVVPIPVERCVHEMIEDWATSQPTAPAVCAWDGELSYGQLARMATGLAGQLALLGVRQGTVVPLCFEKSMWTTVAMLGVLKAGAAFVLLDSSLPEARLLALSRQVKANVVISGDLERKLNCQLASHVIVLGMQASHALSNQAGPPANLSSPSDVMYIAFTSGSTGTPKGAVITHRNLASALYHQQSSLRRTSSSRVYDFCSYTFDVSICNTFSTLAAGGCLCVPSEQQKRDRFVESIASLKANAIDLTTSVARLLSPDQVPGIDTLVFGGETLHPKDVSRWWGRVNIINLYGPCECTPNSTINANPTSIEDATHLGKGLGLLTWVVDADDHDVLLPPGCVGELLLEGPIVGQGYLEDPERTAATFIENPLWLLVGSPQHPGRPGRLYKTGDLVRFETDGSLTFVGRKDSQVKIRGQRVELGEVEHALRTCESVDDAVAVLQYNNNRDARMVAFVTMQDHLPPFDKGGFLQQAETTRQDMIRETLKQKLPSFMVPEIISILLEFPITKNGKIDRKALANRQETGMIPFPEQPTRALSTAETQLAELWANVLDLDVDRIGAHTNFFQLGGSSIDAMKVAAKGQSIGLGLTVAAILRHPALHELAEAVVYQPSPPQAVELKSFALMQDTDFETLVRDISGLCNLDRGLIQDVYPCTPLQEGIMSLSLQSPQSYVGRRVLELGASVSLGRLKAAWEKLVRNTPILRTRIVQHHELGMLQVVVSETIDWIHSSSLTEYLQNDRKEAMELGNSLARYALVKDDSNSCKWLVWTAHHTLYDGWSLKLVADALGRIYEGLPVDYGIGMQAFIRHVQSQSDKTALEYWRQVLDNYDSVAFPQIPPHVQQPTQISMIEYTIPRVQNNSPSATSSILIRAAWALAVRRLTSSADVVFGVTVYGRSAPVAGIEKLMTPTFATIPVRVQSADNQLISEYLELLQRQAIGMMPFEQTGLQNISKASPAAQRACSFQTQLIIQHEEGIPLDDTLIGKCLDNDLGEAGDTCALTLEMFVCPSQIRVLASFYSEVLEPTVLQTLLELFHQVLNQLDDAAPHLLLSKIGTVIPRDMAQYTITATGAALEAKNDIDAKSAAMQEPNSQPMSETERHMQKIWASVLNIPSHTIALDHSFFRLGGNSIDAMKVVSKALHLGLQVRVVDIFGHPRLRDLASHTSKHGNGNAGSVQRAPGSEAVEQSFAQEGLWLVYQQDPTLTWDIIPCAWRLRGPLQVESLQTALLALERRHESLRTVFLSRDGLNLQKVKDFKVEKQKLEPIALNGPGGLVDALREDQLTPFKLQTEAGWRVRVYQLCQQDYCLSIVLHHIICDGWSMDLLWKELAVFYAAANRGQNPLSTVDPLPVQYRDYAVWQRQKDEDYWKPQLDYWTNQLRASPPAELPCDKARPVALSGRVEVHSVHIQHQLYESLQEFCKEFEVTPFVVLLAAFRAAHFLLTGVGDAVIGVPNANRGRWQDKDVLGLLVNLQCIRTKVGKETFVDLVRQVQAAMLAAFHRQETPFEMILSKLGIRRDLSRHPIFQIIMADHSQLAFQKFELEGVETEPIVPTVAAAFDLQLHIYQETGSLRVEVIYSADLFETATIEKVMQDWQVLLERGLSHADATIKFLGGVENHLIAHTSR